MANRQTPPAPPAPPISLANLIGIFTTQLTVSIHTILAVRGIYPETTFMKARAYNYPIMQSRHPVVCEWINDGVKAIEKELQKGHVARVALVIFEDFRETTEAPEEMIAYDDAPDDDEFRDADQQMDRFAANEIEFDSNGSPITTSQPSEDKRGRRSNKSRGPTMIALERYVWDVSRWPQMPKSDLNTPFSHEIPNTTSNATTSNMEGVEDSDPAAAKPEPSKAELRAKFRGAMQIAQTNLHEQFRGLLARLSTISSRIAPLPNKEACTFTLCIELKEDGEAPLKHPQAWIPSETPLQRRILSEREKAAGIGTTEKAGGKTIERGKVLGGTRTTPVRSVDTGEMVFEMWVEEAKEKFEILREQKKKEQESKEADSS